MRIHQLLCATILLSSVATAQFSKNGIEIWPGATNFTSRGSIANNTQGGTVLQGFHESQFNGVGNGTADGFTHILQDQNTDTQEQYCVVYYTGTDAAGPDSANPPACEKGPFTSPPRGTGGVIQAWGISFNWGTAPCTFPLVDSTNPTQCVPHFLGIKYVTNPPGLGWTNDGISSHMSRGETTTTNYAMTVQCSIDSTATTHEDVAWQIQGGANAVGHPSLFRAWRFRHLLDNSTLQVGNATTSTGTKYGKGGSQPFAGAPLSVRCRYGSTNLTGTSLLFVGITKSCPGFGGFGGGINVYLGALALPDAIPAAIGTVGGVGEAVHILGTTPSPAAGVTVFFQAAAATTSGLTITNAQSSTL